MDAPPTSVRITGVTDDEYPQVAHTIALAFGETLTDDDVAHHRAVTDLDRSVAARDGDLIVGAAMEAVFTMTVPYAAPVACAGVTGVGVRPTHRRRGVLRALMRAQLDMVRDRGDAWAALYASESAIYGRFGYGVASRAFHFAIERQWTTLATPPAPATVELVDADAAAARLPAIYAAAREPVPGMMMDTSHEVWARTLTWDPESERDGAGPRQYAVIGDRGYATYRIRRDWDDTGPNSTAQVEQLIATDAATTRQLWAYVFGIDLVARVRADQRPADDPLPWWLVERKRLRVTEAMSCYVRLVDVGAALSSRGTRAHGAVVVDVADGFCPWNQRRWQVTGDGGRLTCTPTTAVVDLRMDARELASLSLGAVTAGELVRADLVAEATDGAADRLTALLAAPRAPWNPAIF